MDPLWRKCKFQEQSKCTKSLSLKWKVNMIRVEREREREKKMEEENAERRGSGGEGGYRRGEKECFLSREWDLHISGRKCPIFKGHPSQPDKKCHLKLDGRGAKWINKYINKSTNKPSKLTEFQKTGVEEGQVLWGGRPTDIKLKKIAALKIHLTLWVRWLDAGLKNPAPPLAHTGAVSVSVSVTVSVSALVCST